MGNTTGDRFRFEYDTPILRYGVGWVKDLGDELDRNGYERALAVCGTNVGDNPEVMDSVSEGLGDRLVGVFDETTPEKRLETAYRGVEKAERCDGDVLVTVGGGSSFDTAKMISVLSGDDREPDEVGDELTRSGLITVPSSGLLPVVAVPTTPAGADLSSVA